MPQGYDLDETHTVFHFCDSRLGQNRIYKTILTISDFLSMLSTANVCDFNRPIMAPLLRIDKSTFLCVAFLQHFSKRESTNLLRLAAIYITSE
jgi:hypothetical protein